MTLISRSMPGRDGRRRARPAIAGEPSAPAGWPAGNRGSRVRVSIERTRILPTGLLTAMVLLWGALAAANEVRPATGPVDGLGLPPTDLARVAVGTAAPDFALEGQDGEVVRLSGFRGRRNVVLSFYRGHW